jgi:hypothetical protein
MALPFMTRNIFDTLIIIIIVVGLILAARRLRADLTRPMPDDDTDPHKEES